MMVKEVKVAVLVYGSSMRAALFGLLEFFQLASEVGAKMPDPVRFSCECFSDDLDLIPEGVKGYAIKSLKNGYAAVIVPPQTRSPEAGLSSAATAKWLARQHASGSVLAAACVGVFVLAECGLLDGRRATTHWLLADLFRERFPSVDLVDEEMVVDEGDVVTAGGVTAWVDLALRLALRFGGAALAMRLGKYYLVDTGLREQRFYRVFQPRFNHGDLEVTAVQHWIGRHYSEAITNEELALEGGMSVRSLQRRFAAATGESPVGYLRKFRLAKACELLESSKKTVDDIVWAIGYEDQSAFRKLFKEQMGLTPSEYRKRFAF